MEDLENVNFNSNKKTQQNTFDIKDLNFEEIRDDIIGQIDNF